MAAAVTRTVADVMSQPVVTAGASDDVGGVAGRMAEHGVGAVVVVDERRAPVGIITERDVLGCIAAGVDPATAPVEEWMSGPPDTCTPDDDVVRVTRRLSDNGYRHVPVVDDGQVVGMVSLRNLVSEASLEPVRQPGAMEAPRGLAGVIVAETEVGDVRGDEGFYHYRQYDAAELARHCQLEDVWFLLSRGHFPDAAERAAFDADMAARREIPAAVLATLPTVATAGDPTPLEALRTAVSLVAAAEGMRPSLDLTPAELRSDGERICAVIPTLIAALWRLGEGLDPVAPDPSLGYAANYLYMLTGTVPDPGLARAVEQYQITTIDHGFNASTFTARVITSTGADVGAAVVGAIGALSGPLHGGAPSRALDLLDEIRTPERTAAVVRDKVSSGERIMGFGHRVYRTDDPRSVLLREVAQRIGGDRIDFAQQVERTVVDTLAELKPGRQLYTNVEFYAGVVMERAGLPPELFTPTFASSRVIGWCANICEQAGDNRIIRPSARYVGPPPPQPLPDS